VKLKYRITALDSHAHISVFISHGPFRVWAHIGVLTVARDELHELLQALPGSWIVEWGVPDAAIDEYMQEQYQRRAT
jgi:hypothetical protein